MEKISLGITPVVVFEGENWNVQKANHLSGDVDIMRNIVVVRGKHSFYDIETKTVHASELYKSNSMSMPIKTIKEW